MLHPWESPQKSPPATSNPRRTSSVVDDDVGADGVQDVDRFGSPQLPGARDEGVGLRRQRADRADVDHVAGELAGEHLLDVGADLQVVASARRPELLHARDLVAEPDASGALRLDRRSPALFFCTLSCSDFI